jgi:hypothetical protein
MTAEGLVGAPTCLYRRHFLAIVTCLLVLNLWFVCFSWRLILERIKTREGRVKKGLPREGSTGFMSCFIVLSDVRLVFLWYHKYVPIDRQFLSIMHFLFCLLYHSYFLFHSISLYLTLSYSISLYLTLGIYSPRYI